MLWLGSLTCTVLVVYYDYPGLTAVTLGEEAEARRIARLSSSILVGFYSCNIATNFFSTGTTTLICFVI